MATEEERKTTWSGFSDYEEVAATLHEQINDAVNAYAHIDSKRRQNVGITPQTAVKARQQIVRITKRLAVEVERNKENDKLKDVYEDWYGAGDEPGYLDMLERSDFLDEHPDWLGEHIDHLITAGWELGYLKAGMEQEEEPDDPDEQAKGMFK